MSSSELMEEQSLMSLNPFLSALPIGSCPAITTTTMTNSTNCFLFPDTPPLTPAINGLANSTSAPSYGSNSTSNSQANNFSSSAPVTPRTPRKPAHPCRFALSSLSEKSAIISFKMIQNGDTESPSLSITSRAPCRRRLSGVRRRLWVNQGESSERFALDANDCLPFKQEFKVLQSKLPMVYGDGIEADDEMDGNSASSSISPPYSPSDGDMVSEASATKPTSSSCSYLLQPHHNHQHLFIQTTSKQRAYSPKIKPTHKSKTCASCKTKKTPLWRDSEDGISYCNACGIRFKKYRVRCSSCQYIPRKDEREMSKQCCRCGSPLVHCKMYSR